jgi:hypothetical protein
MSKKISRRDFVISSAAAGLAATAPLAANAQAPAVRTSSGIKPVVIAARNGLTRKNGGELSCVETAFEGAAPTCLTR